MQEGTTRCMRTVDVPHPSCVYGKPINQNNSFPHLNDPNHPIQLKHTYTVTQQPVHAHETSCEM
jgi:hypothetical protein